MRADMLIDNDSPRDQPASAPKLRVILITPTELLEPSRKAFLRNLVRLLNDAYAEHGHPSDDGSPSPKGLFLRKRVIADESWVEELGENSLVAVCVDEALQNTANETSNSDGTLSGRPGRLVATASLKPWKGTVAERVRAANEALQGQNTAQSTHDGGSDAKLTEAAKEKALETERGLTGAWNWEVSSCASCDDPRYRGKGLMIRCIDALVEDLKIRHAEIRKLGHPKGDLPIKLWSTSLEGTGNTAYWQRRGFVKAGEADVVPAATWSSVRDLTLQTLSKVVE